MRTATRLLLVLLLVLVCGLIVGGSQALGAESEPDLVALAKQCTVPKQTLQCREMLSVCEQLFVGIQKMPLPPDAAPLVKEISSKILSQLAWCENELGHYSVAERYQRHQLALSQQTYGPEHVAVAAALNALAVILERQGKYAPSESLYRQALSMQQRLLGSEHPDIALCLNNLADVLLKRAKYTESELLYRRALAMRRKLLGGEHEDVASSLNSLALLLDTQGDYTEAESLYRQALAMHRKLLGTEHTNIAQTLSNLGLNLSNQGKYAEAEPMFRQALAMQQNLLGNAHPYIAQSLNVLAGALQIQGKYAAAEQLFRHALTMRQQLLGAVHPDVASSMNNLGLVLRDQNKYAEAEHFYRQALSMDQTLLGIEHPAIAQFLNNLALVFDEQGKYTEAEKSSRRALAMNRKLLGAEHSAVAYSLEVLAGVLASQGKDAESELLYRQALAMRKKLLGSEHPDVSQSLNNLAILLHRQSKFAETEQLFRQALAIRQKLLSTEHPDVALSLFNLGSCLLAQGRQAEVVVLYQDALRIREEQLRTVTSETRMQALLDLGRTDEEAIYGLLLDRDVRPATLQLALTTALLHKGRAAEAGASVNRLLHRNRESPELQQRVVAWQEIQQQRDALLYGSTGAVKPQEYRARLTALRLQAESLEAQLVADLPRNQTLQPPKFDDIVSAVAKRLPENGALIEIVWTRQFHPQNDEKSRWGEPHYIALLLFSDRRVQSLDLGPAAELDDRTRTLLKELQSPDSPSTAAAEALYQNLLKPLLPLLAGKTDLYLSPDGTLNLVPFDALHDGTDYVLGRYRFHYLTSGRDLLREHATVTTQSALLLANPDFGKAPAFTAPGQSKSLYQRLVGLTPLPGTEVEAKGLAPLLGVTPLLAGKASEAAVRAARSPFILHIATHGLFLRDLDYSSPVMGERGLRRASALTVSRSKNVAAPTAELLPGENDAMNRSALALAGVLQGDSAGNTAKDGLLTAEEARSLDLEGTQLVVLSACETGQGALSAGQGVYGLRRAFLVAGAETLVTSLWRVSDDATGELMTLYYRKLLDKQKPGDRLDAMVEATKELRSRKDGARAHPYYWAPFLVIGQDGLLSSPPGSMPAHQ